MSHNTMDVNTVFSALTRPAMTGGVTLEYHGFNLMLSVCAFIVMGNLLYGLIFIPVHAVGWMICRNDPSLFVILKKLLKLPSMLNKSIWGVRSYEPF